MRPVGTCVRLMQTICISVVVILECKSDKNGWPANVDKQSMVHNLQTGNL